MSDGTMIFEIFQGGQHVHTEELSQDIIKIGKLPSSHLKLDDPQVSRIHAVIERSKDGSVYIIDLGSSRGTLVNGSKVNKWKLSDGDEILLGGTTVRFRMSGAPAFDPEATQVGGLTPEMLAAAGVAAGNQPSYEDNNDATQLGMSAMPDDDEEPARPALRPAPQSLSQSQPKLSRPAPAPSSAPTQVARPPIAAAAAPVAAAPVAQPAPQQQQVYASSAASYTAEPAASVQTQGWYDDQGNWHDGTGGWYDPEGNYYDGTGGWYDPDGNYFDGQGGYYDPEGNYFLEDGSEPRVRDLDVYTESFLETNYDASGAGVLEVAFMWNDHVLSVSQYRKATDITIGEAPKTSFQMKDDSIPDPKFPIVKNEGGQPVLNFTAGMSGLFYVGDKQYSLEELIASGQARQGGYGAGSYSLPMTAQTRARIGVGSNTVLVHYAAPATGVSLGLLAVDVGLVGNLGLSTLLHAIFMFLVFFIPPGAQDFRLDSFDVNNRFVSQIIKPEEPEKEEEPDWMKEKNKQDEEEGAKAKEDEGKAGEKTSKEKDKKMAVKGPADNKEVQLAKDREKAYNTGALDVLSKNSQLTASWGQGQETLGMAAITAMGDNNGDRIGEAFGVGAFGRTGAGRGGGGVSERSFGAGRIGTAGRGGGGEGGSDYGRNAGQLDDRDTVVPKVVPGSPVVTGSLDKEIIRRVIRRHRAEIKYCYERELIKNKTLAGKVVVAFTISGTGAVVAASATGGTLNNGSVSSCIASKVRRWVFPEPNGGGIVRVSYPFVFAPQN